MSFNDYVKFVTQQVVLKMDQPKEQKQADRIDHKKERLPLRYHAFGMIPLGLSVLWKKRHRKK